MEEQLLKKPIDSDNWLFTHITPLVKKINALNNQIQNKDLKEFVVKTSDCQKIVEQLKLIIETKTRQSYSSIFKSFFRKRVLQILGIQTLIDFIMLSNIFMLNIATNQLQVNNGQNVYKTIVPILAIIGLSLIKTYLHSKIDYFVYLIVLKLRIITQYLLFDKALKVQCISKKEESDTHTANINTLLTADLEEIMLINYTIRDLWEAILLITGCLIFLYHLDSHAGTVVVITMISTQFFNLIVSIIMMKSENKMLEYKDQRVGISTDIIEGMKQIKYLSWEKIFSDKVMKFRKKEFSMLIILKIFDGLCLIFWNNVSYVLLCAYIISCVNNGKQLSDINIFTLIAVFNTMVYPLGILPWSINCGILSYVSFKRILKFLSSQEINSNNKIYFDDQNEEAAIYIQKNTYQWPIEKTELQQNKQNKNQISEEEIVFTEDNENSQFLLKVNNFKIKKHTINFIIGKIGSGKSALFNAILNELQINSSNIFENKHKILQIQSFGASNQQIKGKISYCSQSSWVQNMSVRDNILFGNLFDQQLYNEIIEICQLKHDIKSLENQDLYEIGPDGKNLSGGQKQRITLARALYQKCDIYLFDDIFSSLDVHIADKIFQKVIIEYLLSQGKTVLFITSHYRYLNQIPNYIQKKIMLIQNGLIYESQNIINDYLEKEYTPNKEVQDQALLPFNLQLNSKEPEKEQLQSNNEDNSDENQEEREQGRIDLNTWTTYFRSMNWFILIVWIIINFGMQGSMTFIDFWLKSELMGHDSWLHSITTYFNNSFTDTLFYLTLFALLVTSIRAFLYILTALRSAWILFFKLNKTLIASVMRFYDKTNAGRIINRIQDDTTMIDHELNQIFHCLLENVGRVTGLSIGLLILQPIFIILLILIVFLYYEVCKVYMKPNREIKRLKSINQGALLQVVNETLTGIKIIRAFKKNELFSELFLKKLSNWVVTDQCGERSKLWFGVRLNLMSNLILICVSSFVIISLFTNFTEDYTVQALAITYSMVILDNFYDLFAQYLRMESGIVSVERVKQYFRNEQEDIDAIPKQQIINHFLWKDIIHFKEFDDQDAIVFRNLFLTYEDVSNEAKFALNNFSLTIKKGQKVAIVGRTGSGKTSIFNILFGLYKFQHGQILINGCDVQKLTLRQLRNQFSVVPQFGFLYNASVKENLDPEDNQTKENIENLLNDTGFQLRGINNASSSFCSADFIISQNGSNLSNGEKQVLNFLRIILQNKDIICLDEATSNMDPKTDKLLHDLLFKFTENKSLLVITHRLENINIFDKIIVMEEGQIVEQGNYLDLIKIEGGFFNKLMSPQGKNI